MTLLERIKLRLELLDYNPWRLLTYIFYWRWNQPNMERTRKIMEEIEAMYAE